ncbi:hypothetical protein B0A52_09581 [Exophiala mesophila]|uniref:pyridoxal 5'-phosphate synthase n=1 Tax=Exophiala mesophila TaxID=212818 RepID=A0A438MT74_EXOME|nr:hypothetical protein B0A52_09581 [Exophiala mesophila]
MLHQAKPSSSLAAKPAEKLIFAPGNTTTTTTNSPPPPSSGSTNPVPPQAAQAAQFQLSALQRTDLSHSPFLQFHQWFTDPSLASQVPETVTLSTAELPSGRVSSRMVYLKELDSRGFVIYSNFGTSRKAADLATNPYASLCFWWKVAERQVRVEGRVERLSEQESQVYFDTRARGSRIGAWASQQSKILQPNEAKGEGGNDDDGRAELEAQVAEVKERFDGQDHIPVPPFWGGLRVIPDTVEFWQGRESRLHDRFRYSKVEGSDDWEIVRLSP